MTTNHLKAITYLTLTMMLLLLRRRQRQHDVRGGGGCGLTEDLGHGLLRQLFVTRHNGKHRLCR